MNSLTDPHEHDLRSASSDREITLGTTLLLGIFFAIAAVCAAFFGFGYSLGAKHTNGIAVASEPQPSLKLNGAKPSAGSTAVEARPAAESAKPESVAAAPAAEKVAVDALAPESVEPLSSRAHAPVAATAVPSAPPSSATPGVLQFLVQIAAVSHQEDADLIASTLTRRGYGVNIRSEPQDKLLHVQVGPFASKKDAEAMRQRLMADGFNAYIK